MDKIFNIINIPLGYILDWISKLFGGNFAASVFVFTIIVNIAMIPLNIKSQKSSVQQMRIKPKLDKLKEKYGDDQRKYNAAMQELYSKEGVSMSGGCLPLLIRFPIMISIYYLIRSPLQYLAHVPTDIIQAATEKLPTVADIAAKQLKGNEQILAITYADKLGMKEITEAAKSIDFNFLGIDLTQSPKFSMDIIHNFNRLWWIPILAFAAAMLSSILSLVIQKKINPDAPSMAGMMLTMPVISLIFAFTFPCAVGFYWACSSLIGGVIQSVSQYFYGPNAIIARERVNDLSKAYKDELARAERKGASK